MLLPSHTESMRQVTIITHRKRDLTATLSSFYSILTYNHTYPNDGNHNPKQLKKNKGIHVKHYFICTLELFL